MYVIVYMYTFAVSRYILGRELQPPAAVLHPKENPLQHSSFCHENELGSQGLGRSYTVHSCPRYIMFPPLQNENVNRPFTS